MPQPLSRVNPNASIMIGNAGDRPLLRHPELAALAAEAIASWANVESFMLKLFVEMFGGNEALATNIFLSLNNQSAKNDAIRAAADSFFENGSDELAVFRALLAISKTNEKDRNKLAHWTWGDSPNLPDALLLIDPRTTIGDLDKASVYVYRENDFRSIIDANDRLCGFGLQFKFVISGHVANRDGELLRELMNEPEISQRVGG
ncbi:hypothetical protein [Salinisphaera hydrothermalis]|uniref:hypothetical protein n=1 Tax=Salinisphaera hydrothermalis TaxID=563188 RepID=UPI0012EB568F|nr:hypothetical protein [Salinisphaera hydrothermalis]